MFPQASASLNRVIHPGISGFSRLSRLYSAQLGQELRVLNVGRWQTDSGHLMEMVKDAYKRGRLGTWGT